MAYTSTVCLDDCDLGIRALNGEAGAPGSSAADTAIELKHERRFHSLASDSFRHCRSLREAIILEKF